MTKSVIITWLHTSQRFQRIPDSSVTMQPSSVDIALKLVKCGVLTDDDGQVEVKNYLVCMHSM